MKKIVSTFLIAMLLNIAFGASAFAQTSALNENGSAKSQLKAQFEKELGSSKAVSDFGKAEKETMASYKKSKMAGKKFSTGKKILIGFGIAAAVVGIVVFAASRDKIRTF